MEIVTPLSHNSRGERYPSAARYYPSLQPRAATAHTRSHLAEERPAAHSPILDVWGAWVRVLTPGAYVPVHANPRRALLAFRRWSPALVPSLAGGVLLAAFLYLVYRGVGDPASAGLLFVAYLLGGALQGLMLHLAPNDAAWLGILLLGTGALAATFAALVMGPLGALVVLAVMVGALLLYTRWRQVHVRPGTVVATLLLRRYARVLRPGTNVVLPGERVLAVLPLGKRRYTCPMDYVEIRSALGGLYRARAAITVRYELNLRRAYRAALCGDGWEDALREVARMCLHEALHGWTSQLAQVGGEPSAAFLARQIQHDLQTYARRLGARINGLEVLSLQVQPVSGPTARPSRPSVAQSRDRTRTPSLPRVQGATPVPVPVGAYTATHVGIGAAFTPLATSERTAAPPPTVTPFAPVSQPPLSETVQAVPQTTLHATIPPSTSGVHAAQPALTIAASAPPPLVHAAEPADPAGAEEDEAPHYSREALADLYEAVRERRITDPQTIDQIARAFEQAASEQEPGEEMPFDAASAARILRAYARQLER